MLRVSHRLLLAASMSCPTLVFAQDGTLALEAIANPDYVSQFQAPLKRDAVSFVGALERPSAPLPVPASDEGVPEGKVDEGHGAAENVAPGISPAVLLAMSQMSAEEMRAALLVLGLAGGGAEAPEFQAIIDGQSPPNGDATSTPESGGIGLQTGSDREAIFAAGLPALNGNLSDFDPNAEPPAQPVREVTSDFDDIGLSEWVASSSNGSVYMEKPDVIGSKVRVEIGAIFGTFGRISNVSSTYGDVFVEFEDGSVVLDPQNENAAIDAPVAGEIFLARKLRQLPRPPKRFAGTENSIASIETNATIEENSSVGEQAQ